MCNLCVEKGVHNERGPHAINKYITYWKNSSKWCLRRMSTERERLKEPERGGRERGRERERERERREREREGEREREREREIVSE